MEIGHFVKLAADSGSFLGRLAPTVVVGVVSAALTMWGGSIRTADAVTQLQTSEQRQDSQIGSLLQDSSARSQQISDMSKKIDHISDAVDRLYIPRR
jgi:hypothetical protein